MIAALEAWADAGFERQAPDNVDPDRLGVVMRLRDRRRARRCLSDYDVLHERARAGSRRWRSRCSCRTVPAANVGLDVGAQAGVHTPVSACASGAEGLAYGMDMIRLGRADIVVAGGTEAAIHPLPMAAFANMMALSKRNDEPGDAPAALGQGP